MTQLIEPHGGTLCDLLIDGDKLNQLIQDSLHLDSLTLNDRQLCDIEMLINGSFSPLTGFLTEADYNSVVNDLHLSNGNIWPIPITLDVKEELSKNISVGDKLVLRDHEGVAIAILTVSDKWTPDRKQEAELVYGTQDSGHPAVDYLLNQSGAVYLGGKIEGLELPRHYDYKLQRNTPAELRAQFKKMGWTTIVAFQTRNPMHRAHKEITVRAAREIGGNLLIHPVVGMTKPGDVDHYTRVRCYKTIMEKFPEDIAIMSLLPLAMRMGGPREALWHALIRKNYGCTHLIVGRDHAGPGNDSEGNPFYGPYDAQGMVNKYADEIGVKMVPFKLMVYVEERAEYMPIDEVPEELTKLNVSGTELRRRLDHDLEIPEWFSYSEVVEELRHSHPPKDRRGFTVFFTGLSGSGKSTIANALLVKFLEHGRRRVTLLDGDIVRINLSSELGFSMEHRNLNITRIGFVASEITKNGGIAICAPIAPYEAIRKNNRELISKVGGYIEVHVSTPLDTCEKRDVKGLYAKARQGIIKGFTGIDDPYEKPINPELSIDTTSISQEEAVQQVLVYLENEGYLT
ncbi:MAG: bifunctional sulfate adenylyltransferase/adenylylsulfate kinase [Candidatus Marinimicrobia bacterium]|nr:bifunctional sulfate adenylyltransferase/adenylylsulfate kinase [Candidatus Neomarinimicrobiota bacterium]